MVARNANRGVLTMYKSFIFVLLLSLVAAAAPTGTDPIPVLPVTPIQPPSARTGATVEVPTTTVVDAPNTVRTSGLLQIPKWNNVVLAANFQAMLMSLKTEQRDEQGNIATDAQGRPIMIPIREGMYVFKDQVLGHFDDREMHILLAREEKKLDVAIADSEKKIEIEYAEKQAKTSWANAEMLKATNRLVDSAISKIEILKADLELEQAKANYQLQEYTINVQRAADVEVQRQEVEGMKVRISLRQLVAPIAGMIVKIDKAEGEWLREGDPVLEIVQLETLRAECKVDAQRCTPDRVMGKKATVYVAIGNGQTKECQGKVVFANPKIISSGRVFEVFIEVQNQRSGQSWQLQPGRDVTAIIHLEDIP